MKKLALALAATAALSAASLTPAMANYSYCTENPSAANCPGDFNVKDEPFAQPRHASERHMLRSTKSASYKNEPSKSASSKSSPAKSAAHEPHQPAKQRG